MSLGPSIPTAEGSLSIGSFADPLLVDPDPALLSAVVEAYRETAPDLVDPDLRALRVVADRDPDAVSAPADLPTLTVLATPTAFESVTNGFRDAARLAGLTAAEAVEPLALAEPQPNVILAGDATGCVLVEAASDAVRWYRVGDDPRLRDRYAAVVTNADPYRLRTPSRRRVYDAFRERSSGAVAGDVIRLLDPGPALSADHPVGPRTRAYAVGARHGVHDRTLRRACEDAGLGSPSTFTRIKRRLIDAGLVETERVPRPVGRPRERVVATGRLQRPPLEGVADAIRESLGE
ncbi:hypothetical protein DQW50_04750 [Halorubrum sp. 48-1-W]|uniref:transcriptional regulator TbsP domain-containing protein n=1 Tax=Halorubrum sp. 48-1-W TaxID=2249761 RepID=UPI000DCE1BFF|nr:DUF5821 family protein [Halorubrum sp. 48-1-W]RAW46092.1 hypothetical protein DQW50_04750 [Halorubrum sp. 48-1-W]